MPQPPVDSGASIDPLLQTLLSDEKTREAERQRLKAAETVLEVTRTAPWIVVERIEALTEALRAVLHEDTVTKAERTDEEHGLMVAQTQRALAEAVVWVAKTDTSPATAEAVAVALSARDTAVVRAGVTAAHRFALAVTDDSCSTVALAGIVATALATVIERDPKLSESDLAVAGRTLKRLVDNEPAVSKPLVEPLARAVLADEDGPPNHPALSALDRINTRRPKAVASCPNLVEQLVMMLSRPGATVTSWETETVAIVMRLAATAPESVINHLDVIRRVINERDSELVQEPAIRAVRNVAAENPAAVTIEGPVDIPVTALYSSPHISDSVSLDPDLYLLRTLKQKMSLWYDAPAIAERLDKRAQLLSAPDIPEKKANAGVVLAVAETLVHVCQYDPAAVVEFRFHDVIGSVLRDFSDGEIILEALAVLAWVATVDPEGVLEALDETLDEIGTDPWQWVDNEQRFGPPVAVRALVLYRTLAETVPVRMAFHADAIVAAQKRAGDLDPTEVTDVLEDLPIEQDRLINAIDPATDLDVTDGTKPVRKTSILPGNLLNECYKRLGSITKWSKRVFRTYSTDSAKRVEHPPALATKVELLNEDARGSAAERPMEVLQELTEVSRQGQHAAARRCLRPLAATAATEPSALDSHLGGVLRAATRLDDPAIATDALAVVLEVAARRPDTVKPYLGAVADLTRRHEDERVTLTGAGIVAHIARHAPDMAAESVEPLVNGLAAIVDDHPEYAGTLLDVLAIVALDHPGAVEPHLGTVIEAGTTFCTDKTGVDTEGLLATLSTLRSVGVYQPGVVDEHLMKLFAHDWDSSFRHSSLDVTSRENLLLFGEFSIVLSELTALTRHPSHAEELLDKMVLVFRFGWNYALDTETDHAKAIVAHVAEGITAALHRFDDREVARAAIHQLSELANSFPSTLPETAVLNAMCTTSDPELLRTAVRALTKHSSSIFADPVSVRRFVTAVADTGDPYVLTRGVCGLERAAAKGSDPASGAARPLGASVRLSYRPHETLTRIIASLRPLDQTDTAFLVSFLSGYWSADDATGPTKITAAITDMLATILDSEESAVTTAAAVDLVGHMNPVVTDDNAARYLGASLRQSDRPRETLARILSSLRPLPGGDTAFITDFLTGYCLADATTDSPTFAATTTKILTRTLDGGESATTNAKVSDLFGRTGSVVLANHAIRELLKQYCEKDRE